MEILNKYEILKFKKVGDAKVGDVDVYHYQPA